MIFHSLDFVVFFVVVVALYWRLPHRGQNVLLLVASYFFYGYVHPVVPDPDRLVDGRRLLRRARHGAVAGAQARVHGDQHRLELRDARLLQVLQLLRRQRRTRCSTAAGLHASLPVLRVILPVGISFYTFQAMSYTIDVYRGELRARRSLLDVAVFISFFPHLVAGPIQRASYLLPQVEGGATLLAADGARAASASCAGASSRSW